MLWVAPALAAELALPDALRAADAIVVVEVREKLDVKLPIPGTNVNEPRPPCGTYAWYAWSVQVVEVVDPGYPAAPLRVGDALTVYPHGTARLIEAATRTCTEGIQSLSSAPSRYPGETPDPGDRLLVLLAWQVPTGWSEAVPGGWMPGTDAARVAISPKVSRIKRDDQTPENLLCVRDSDCVASPIDCTGCSTCGMVPARVDAAAIVGAACVARANPMNSCECPAVAPPDVACQDMRCVYAGQDRLELRGP